MFFFLHTIPRHVDYLAYIFWPIENIARALTAAGDVAERDGYYTIHNCNDKGRKRIIQHHTANTYQAYTHSNVHICIYKSLAVALHTMYAYVWGEKTKVLRRVQMML